MRPILSASGIQKRYPAPGRPPVQALRGVDLDIQRGEVVGLVGESGSGKSTLGRILLRLVDPDDGTVHFDGVDLRRLPATSLRALRRRIQYVPQNASAALNPQLTVREHLVETVGLHRPQDLPRAPMLIEEALARFQLAGRADRLPHALSGGERRRVAVLRALLPEPDLVVADEPTAGLDASVKAEVLDLMLAGARNGTSWLFISHELDVIRYAATRVLVLLDGTVVESLPPARLRPPAGPLHPYTVRLVRSGFEPGCGALPARPLGRSPGPGCIHATRCDAVSPSDPLWARCFQEGPRLLVTTADHQVACHRFFSETP